MSTLPTQTSLGVPWVACTTGIPRGYYQFGANIPNLFNPIYPKTGTLYVKKTDDTNVLAYTVNGNSIGGGGLFVFHPQSLVQQINQSQTPQVACIYYFPFDGDTTEHSQLVGQNTADYPIIGTGCALSSTVFQVGNGSLYNPGSTSFLLGPGITPNSNGYTIAFFIYLNDATPGSIFYFNQANSSNDISISFDGNNINISTNGTNIPVVVKTLNTWQSIVWTQDTLSNSVVYLNSNPVYTGTAIPYLSALFDSSYILGRPQSNSINGYIDDLFYFDGVVSPTNIPLINNISAATYTLSSLQFSGTSQNYSQVATDGNATYYNKTTGTYEVWVKIPTGTTQYKSAVRIIEKAADMGFGIDSSNNIMISQSNNLVYPNGVSNINIGDGNWHHVAMTFSHSVTNGSAIYVDGVLKTNFTWTIYATDQNFIVANSYTYNNATFNDPFTGKLSFIRIWNNVLSSTFIATNYNKYLNPASYSNMIGFYPFNEGSGTVLTNLVGTNNLTIINSPTWTTDSPVINLF